MTVLRATTFAVGLALLAATAHVTIIYTGGYSAPHAILTMAIAIGVGVGALTIGVAWSAGRIVLAWWLLAAIVSGEAFGFLMTAERLIASREAAQAPLRAAQEERAKAAQRVSDADAALAALQSGTPRLDKALLTKAAADAAVVEKSAERGCASNCRQLLQAQVDAAQAEVLAARDEIAAAKATAEAELASSRAVFTGLKVPSSPTPLADRLGWPAWFLDVIAAALGSMAANGLGCGLIAFAAHHGHREDAAAVLASTSIDIAPPRKAVVRDDEHAAQFALEALTPSRDDGADLLAIHGAYRDWCDTKGVDALPAAKIGAALARLFDGTGIRFDERHGRRVALGVAVKGAPKRKALGRMARVGMAHA